jgi:hypothetical protein
LHPAAFPNGALLRLGTELAAGVPFRNGRASVTSACFLPDGKTIFTSSRDPQLIRVWDAQSGRQIRAIKTLDCDVFALSPDWNTLACGGVYSTTICIMNVTTGQELRRITSDLFTRSLAFSPDGTVLAVGQEFIVRLWEVSSGKKLHELRRACAPVAFSPDGKTIATTVLIGPRMAHNTIRLWNALSGKESADYGTKDMYRIRALAFSPDGRLLASAGYPLEPGPPMSFKPNPLMRPIYLWRADTGAQQVEIEKLQKAIYCLAYSPDGRLLAAGDSKGVVSVLEICTGRTRCQFVGHRGPITALAFAPDTRRLVSGSDDATALVWDLNMPIRSAGVAIERRSVDELEKLWGNLAEADVKKADANMREMAGSPQEAVAVLMERVRPIPGNICEQMSTMIGQLSSADFATRQNATREFERLQGIAEVELRKSLERNPSLEMRRRIEAILKGWDGAITSTALLRDIRSIEILERIGTPEARRVLKKLSDGAPGARVTQEARASLQRLDSADAIAKEPKSGTK